MVVVKATEERLPREGIETKNRVEDAALRSFTPEEAGQTDWYEAGRQLNGAIQNPEVCRRPEHQSKAHAGSHTVQTDIHVNMPCTRCRYAHACLYMHRAA